MSTLYFFNEIVFDHFVVSLLIDEHPIYLYVPYCVLQVCFMFDLLNIYTVKRHLLDMLRSEHCTSYNKLSKFETLTSQ